MKRLLLLLALSGFTLPCLAAANGLPDNVQIHVCEDDAEWPPYTFYERQQGKPGKKLLGAAMDVLAAIFNKEKISYSVELIPWKRCLESMKSGREYQMALNLSYNAERDRDYLLSKPYYRLNSFYYYSRQRFPTGLNLSGLDALKQYRVCGLLGYNYSTYGLTPEQMDISSAGFPLMIAKLHAKRCDLFLEKREIMAGFALVDAEMAKLMADPKLVGQPLPGVAATDFHMAVSRAVSYGKPLQALLDRGLSELEKSGEMQKIMDRYIK